MTKFPPQPQVSFVLRKDGADLDGVGHLRWEDERPYAVLRSPLAGRVVVRLDADRLERRFSGALPYYVHHGVVDDPTNYIR